MSRKSPLDDALTPKNGKTKEEYDAKIKERQETLVILQRALYHQNARFIAVFEGWDAAGKGGAIRRLTELLDPRGVKVHSIAAPTPDEQGRHYLYRFWRDLPSPGHMAIFDRSWYGRVLVERVERFASKEAWQRAYGEINDFEGMLVDDGVILVKIFLHISKEEQRQRFLDRLRDPLKAWKMTPEDLRNRAKWDDYERAIEDMLAKTSSREAPWNVVAGDNKHYARAQVLKLVIDALEAHIDVSKPYMDVVFQKDALARLEAEGGKADSDVGT